ncbi:MAG TPA: cupin domain-containing protein [Longimicrobium sp.]|nr:cupin domain-containing protein [Longimicrobium sp.]
MQTMKLITAALASLSLLAAAPGQGTETQETTEPARPAAAVQDTQRIAVIRNGARPSTPGPAENFTGSVRIDPAFDATGPRRAAGATVTFEPGARTAWHTHPRGQTLVVTAGVGRVRQWGQPAREIRPGDVVTIPAGAKHWHGAAPTTAMSHLAIQEARDGQVVQWMEKVSDEQYRGGAAER